MQHQHSHEDVPGFNTSTPPAAQVLASATHANSLRIYAYCECENGLMFRLRGKVPRLPAKRVMLLYVTTTMRPLPADLGGRTRKRFWADSESLLWVAIRKAAPLMPELEKDEVIVEGGCGRTPPCTNDAHQCM